MGKLSEMFSSKNNKKEYEEIPWDVMQKISRDFKERELQLQEKRNELEIKRGILEEKGVDLNEIDIERPQPIEIDDYQDSESLLTITNVLEKKLQDENDYLDRLEKAYDDLLSNS
jgi:hypothetical protein